MKLHRTPEGDWYWFDDAGRGKPDQARGGPFTTRDAAYLWFIDEYEAKLPPHRLALWAEAVKRATHGIGVADTAHLMGLMMAICAGRSPEFVMRAAWPVRGPTRARAPERMMLASGDKDAA